MVFAEELTTALAECLWLELVNRTVQDVAHKNEVRNSGLDCFDQFLGTLEARLESLTNYFTHRSSSGWVAGLNNKIKVLQRRCYGLKNLPNLFRRIWLDLNGYATFAH